MDRARLRRTRAVVAAAGLVLLLLSGGVTPASAHIGGRAQVLVRSLTLTPATQGWRVSLVAVDLDSGALVPGVAFTLSVTSSGAEQQRTTSLAVGDAAGSYQGMLTAAPGPASLEVKGRSAPGWPPIYPYDRTFAVDLSTGRTTQVGDSVHEHGGGAWYVSPLALLTGAAVLVAALLAMRSRSRRPEAPARSPGEEPSGAGRDGQQLEHAD